MDELDSQLEGDQVAAHQPASFEPLSGVELVFAIAQGEQGPEVLVPLRRAMQMYMDLNREQAGTITLDEALGVSAGDFEAYRRAERDVALRQAFKALQQIKPSATAADLREEWVRFLATPTYRAWRSQDHPVAIASPIQRALFRASQANRSEALEERWLRKIVRGIGEACEMPRELGTISNITHHHPGQP